MGILRTNCIDFLYEIIYSNCEVVSLDYELDKILGEYIVIKAEENGVNVIGLTRGRDTKFHHTEKLDKGEVLLAQFTENTSAIKVRGKSKILCRHGEIFSGE
jgi:transcription attenuation protein (tryptophan RNA-binding attenuator protein)